MAKQKLEVVVSDLSGDEVPEGEGAQMRITYDDPSRKVYVLDISAREADNYAAKGSAQKRRGRKKAAAKESLSTA